MRARLLAPVRVLVADQHRIVRAGIKSLLMETRSWQRFEIEEAETTEEAISILSDGQFGVVLIEYGLPGRGGVKATEIILSRWPGTCVLALCDTDDGPSAERMVRVGALGCILRNIGLDTLLFAIRTVMAGKKFYSNEIALRLMERTALPERDPLERLTAREKEVFKAILDGYGDNEIALRMGIGKRTVNKHRRHINYKLGTRSPLELIQAGLRFGLVAVPGRVD
jgi:DNA-binding NarL/FixJ family response regulator